MLKLTTAAALQTTDSRSPAWSDVEFLQNEIVAGSYTVFPVNPDCIVDGFGLDKGGHHPLCIKVALQAGQTAIAVNDNVRIHPPNATGVEFSPRSSLNVGTPGAGLVEPGYNPDGRVRHYRLNRLPPAGKVQLIHRGNIASVVFEGNLKRSVSILSFAAVYADGKADGIMKS